MKKALKIISNILTIIIVIIALFLIITIFPLPKNYKVLTVLSGSMQPAIKTGSLVIVKPVAEYKINDIITFGKISKTEVPTTHRIFDIKLQEGKPIYITKGDANNSPDMKEVLQKQIIGKVLFSIPFAGYIVSAVQKPAGFAIIIILPAIFIMYDEIKKVIKEIKNKKHKL
ncbi:signal peptidase I [Candidatus Parcubacteria bacterium]|nr:signal peptidase I [Patescibacteria group bacterium]MCG2686633.1 signal peptidase I [Candidatus Parcubacteria bacterium]